jgi:LysR family hydrogen peroxide-inducible transcriptional activator
MSALPTLRQLRYLVALDAHRHFGRAADACGATQSTLSAGLQELEAVLGARLVERTKRRVLMTPLGAEVVVRARKLLQDAEDIGALVRGSGQPLSGPLRLGVIPTVGPYLLPKVLPRLRRDYPDLRLYLREDLTARLLDRLSDGDLDLVLLALPYRADEFECEALFADPFFLVCPPGHPLAASPLVPGTLAAAADLLLLEEGHCLREHALAACALPALPGTLDHRQVLGTSLATLVQMVAGGLGVTLLPGMALDCGILVGTDLVSRSLGDDAPARTIGLAWRTSCPRKAEFRRLGEAIRRIHGDRAVG